jgi:hypothetical protein
MDVHRLLSVLITASGAITALIGAVIVGLGLRVKLRVAASRAQSADFDAYPSFSDAVAER